MSESLKFGPEWLRNTISTSPTKQEDSISRPILSENRYSREEMLSFCESSNFRPDPHVTYSKAFSQQWLTPLAFQSEERDRERAERAELKAAVGQSRLFANSGMKPNIGFNWRKGSEEKSVDNWRTQKDSGSTGVFFNNTYNEQQQHQRKKSWRNPENTAENLLEQQKSPPTKYPEGPIVTNKSPSFISPMNKEFLEYHQQSQDNVKNYFESRNFAQALQQPSQMTSAMSSLFEEAVGGVALNLSPPENASVRQGFDVDQAIFKRKQQPQKLSRPKTADKEAAEAIDANIRKLEVDLVKNLTDLVISSEKDFNKGGMHNQLPMQAPPQPPQNMMYEKPPILWFYVDPNGQVQGPFTEEEMSFWYQNNYFHENLMIKRSIDTNFIPLRSLIGVYGTVHPFTVASNYFPIPRIENYFDQFHPSQSIQQPAPVKAHHPLSAAPNMDEIFGQMNFHHHSAKQPLSLPPSQMPMNFLAQPFPTANKMQLPTAGAMPCYSQSDRRCSNKTSAYSQIQPQMAQPPINNSSFDMNNFPTLKQPMPTQTFIPQQSMQQRVIDNMNNAGCGNPMDPIQRILFDIQKQHEINIQQNKMNFFQQSQSHQQQQQQVCHAVTQALVNSNNIKQMNMNNNNSMHHQSQGRKETTNFDADDEGEFRKVENPRKKRFQKEEEDAVEGKEKFETHGIGPSKNVTVAPPVKVAEEMQLSSSAMPSKTVDEERSTQPAMPAPWFNKVVVSQNDDKSVNNIQFTFAERADIKPVAWPKIAPVKGSADAGKTAKKAVKAVEEGKSTLAPTLAPWHAVVRNQHDNEKSLKKIQIEEEEVRQIQLQIRREQEKREQQLQNQKEQAKPVWKAVVQGCAEKENDGDLQVLHNTSQWTKIAAAGGASSQPPIVMQLKEHKQSHSVKVMEPLEVWCVETLKKMNVPYLDIHAFTNFLRSIESPFEIEDYVKEYLGDTMQSNDFLKNFLNYRSNYRNITNSKLQADDLCAPAKAINPPVSTSSAASSINNDEARGVQNKKPSTKKLKKNNMKAVDSKILGFKGAADPNRIVGELEVLNNYVHFDE